MLRRRKGVLTDRQIGQGTMKDSSLPSLAVAVRMLVRMALRRAEA